MFYNPQQDYLDSHKKVMYLFNTAHCYGVHSLHGSWQQNLGWERINIFRVKDINNRRGLADTGD